MNFLSLGPLAPAPNRAGRRVRGRQSPAPFLPGRAAGLETALRMRDPEFHRPEADALGDMARAACGSVDHGGE